MRAMADGVTVERWERLLTLVDILEPLPQEEIKRLAAGRSFIPLGAGETIALEENRQSLFLLVSGRVQVYEPNPSGQYITISVIDEGTIIGQTGFAALTHPALRARALEASVVFRLLNVRLSVGEDRFSDLVHKEVPTRLASIILKLSEHQGIVTRDGSRKVPARYTHLQLGSMIGSNREAVTRALKRLREEGGCKSGGVSQAASDPQREPASPEADRRGNHLQKNCQPTEEGPEARGGDGINPA
jgi:CRP/FNR family cyclic AMP-dependent transcriptional regulator